MAEKTLKYSKIIEIFIQKITSKELLPGDDLPSESELITQYQVSRITIRRALDELCRLGYIEKMQGKRAFVKNTAKMQELTSIYSYTEEILRNGMTPSRKIIHSKLRLCTKDEERALSLQKTDAVFSLERVYYADASPLCYTTTALPYLVFRDIEHYDFEENSLYSIIETDYKIPITKTSLKLKAVTASLEIAELLDISISTPLLYSTAITYGTYLNKEIPIETFSTYYLTDKFEYTLTQLRHS